MINREQNTVIVLEDEIPEIDKNEMSFLKKCISDMGYTVKTMNVEQLLNSLPTGQSFPNFFSNVMIVPNCRNMPLETKELLKYYNENHGSLIFIGGPLYYNYVKSENGGFIKAELDNNTLDANFASDNPYVRSGVAPLYKIYPVKKITQLKTNPEQHIYSDELKISTPIDAIIPCQTNHGLGYNTGANCRFISLVDCYSDYDSDDIIEAGQNNGNRGSFAFIELENTRGLGFEGKLHYGLVEGTQTGSAVAHIGYSGGIQNIPGAEKLLGSIINKLKNGLYLFEAGCCGIRFRDGDDVLFGAQIMNTTSFFKKVNLEFEVNIKNKKQVYNFEKIVSPKCIADVNFRLTCEKLKSAGLEFDTDCSVKVSLYDEGKVLDSIESVFSYESVISIENPDEFVSAKDGKFYYRGKPWYLAGINYWPSHIQSKEKSDYWCGYCDSSNYDPITVEKDLAYMEKLGLNCILMRVDFSEFDHCLHGLRDLIHRAGKHNIKIGLAIPKAIASRYYNKTVVEYLFSKVNVRNNPTIAFIDVEWESGNDGFSNVLTKLSWEFNDEWDSWLTEKYVNLENAQEKLNIQFETDIYGHPAIPVLEKANNTNVTSEVCDFIDNSIKRYWANMYPHLKFLLPNQMITFRFGGAYPKGKTQATDYVDFVPLEIYDFNGFDKFEEDGCRDNCVGLCVAATETQRYETDYKKPIIWAEYGRSACGIKWHEELFYDRENMKYLDREVHYQTLYNDYMQQAVEECNCSGTAPWWWCGGFRYTELADFGYVMPDGTLTESGKSYVAFCERMKHKASETDERESFVVEGNVYDYVDGKNDMLKKIGIEAYKTAKKLDKKLVIKPTYKSNP